MSTNKVLCPSGPELKKFCSLKKIKWQFMFYLKSASNVISGVNFISEKIIKIFFVSKQKKEMNINLAVYRRGHFLIGQGVY